MEELTVAVLRGEEFFDEAVWELLEEWRVEELDDEELLDEFVKMEGVLDKILDERLDEEELLFEERLLDRLEDKLDERLLDRLLEMLLEMRLEMRLEQLIGHAVVVANGAGVIFGVTKDEVGYAHEQTEEI
jgi:hypothetical protein